MSSSNILDANNVYQAPYKTNAYRGAKIHTEDKETNCRIFLSTKQDISRKKKQEKSIKIGSNSESA